MKKLVQTDIFLEKVAYLKDKNIDINPLKSVIKTLAKDKDLSSLEIKAITRRTNLYLECKTAREYNLIFKLANDIVYLVDIRILPFFMR